jgi:hypothetical protein
MLVIPHLMRDQLLWFLILGWSHVPPQFHVVFDDHFTMVQFMERYELPPHWSQLVENLQEKVTEEHYKLAKMWLCPDTDVGDVSMPERNPTSHYKSNRTPGVQEMFTSRDVPSNTLTTGISSTNDASGISQQEEYLPDPLLPSVLSRDYEPSTSKDSLSIPHLINLETAGLRQSPRIAELNRVTKDGPEIAAYTSSTMQLKSRQTTRSKPKLSFLSVFNSVGALWTFATTIPHSDYEHLSFVA